MSRYLLAALMLFRCTSMMGQAIRNDQPVSLLLFGDVNLGRSVGQELVRGNIDYPFRFVRDTLSHKDVVFVNLESVLSEQNGETQHPKYNLIFTGPPSGARALQEANVAVVSTANNHAFDYGFRGLRETLLHLHGSGIECTGSTFDSVGGALPVVIEKNGIRIGFLAYTQFVNLGGGWRGRIALFDSAQCRNDIEALRRTADVVVVSYHGGVEYSDKPSSKLQRSLQGFVDAGADMVVGHHPHYVQGIEMYRGKLIFYSLGNFVFYQPQRELAGFGLGVDVTLARHSGNVEIERARLLAVRAGLQPAFTLAESEEKSFYQRLWKLSPSLVDSSNGIWFVNFQNTHD